MSKLEIEAMLDAYVGPAERTYGGVPYIGYGIATAMGVIGGFRVRNADGEDVTLASAKAFPGGADEFMRLLDDAEVELNRKMIEGPASAAETAGLRGRSGRRNPVEEVATRRLQQEIRLVGLLNQDPHWRRGRIRDVVAAREVFIEINEHLYDSMERRGVRLDTAVDGLKTWREACDSMPSFDVAVTLTAAYHRNPNHRWSSNDVHDIDAMASTVPYCDIVVTDKAVANKLAQSGVLQRFDTVVTARLDDVPPLL